jgi:Flp pilus assembly protein TadD
MSLLLNALKDAEGRKRAQQSAPTPMAAVPAPSPPPPSPEAPDSDLGAVAALLSSDQEDTLLSLAEDIVEPPRESSPRLDAAFAEYTPPIEEAGSPASAPAAPAPAAAPAAAAAPTASPTAFPGLPTPQAILRARAERAAPAQSTQGSTVAAARATRGTAKTRQAAGDPGAEGGLDALFKRVMAHMPAQVREHGLIAAGLLIGAVLLVGWFMLGNGSNGVSDTPPVLGPSLPSATVATAPAATPEGVAGPLGPDDVAPPPAATATDSMAAPPVSLASPVAAPATQPAGEPASSPAASVAATPAPRVPYAGARITPRLEIAGRPSPLPAAYAALRAGDLALAERLYTQTLAGEPDQPDAHLGLAVLAQGRGDDAAAIRHYRAVLVTVPDHPRVWSGLAALVGSGELVSMESKLRSLIAARPAAALHFALGNVLARQGRWAEAQQGFFAASAADPQNADYAFNLAVSLDRIGKASAARPYYERAASLAEAGAPAQFQPAVARQRLVELQPGTP